MVQKSIKRVLLGVLFGCFFFSSTIFGAQEIKIIFDGTQLELNSPAVIENGTTLVPLRNVFEAFGVEPHWDGSTQSVTAKKGDTVIWLQINNKVAKIGEQEVQLNTPAKIINNYTMVPLRFISESFGVVPEWDGSTSTITINSISTSTEVSEEESDDEEDIEAKPDSETKVSVFDLDYELCMSYGTLNEVDNMSCDNNEFLKGLCAELEEDSMFPSGESYIIIRNDNNYSNLEFTIWAETELGSTMVTAGESFSLGDNTTIDVSQKCETYTIDISELEEVWIYFGVDKGVKVMLADPVVY